MYKIVNSQYNYKYGNQIHAPYSIATLVSNINLIKDLKSQFKFEKTFVFRDKLEENILECKDADLLLCSCYIWNWEISTYLAREVKKINPDCLIIFGGPQIPEDTNGFFEKYPYIDIIVHGEGEYTLKNILQVYLEDKNWLNVKGISTKDFRTNPQERINDLSDIPSPYLTNLIWDLVDKDCGVDWDCSWETNRGCPYQCTFCDWGSATFTKVRKFLDDRLLKEVEWFADNKMRYISCCDANFGIFQDRDLVIARKLKEQALEKGFPKKFGTAWAKNTTDKILPIARELRDGGIIGGISLSVQSLDPTTLKNIKRANIKFDKFSDLTTVFVENEIPTYTEIIIGLPGETLESFKEGLETIAQTKVGTLSWGICSVLPNAPMNLPEYKEKFQIKTIRSPVHLRHVSIEYLHQDKIKEFEEIICETSSFTLEELKQMMLFAWVFSTFQNLGVFEEFTQYYRQIYDLSFMSFYETFFEFSKSEKTVFSEEIEIVTKYFDIGFSGKGWDHIEPRFGNINWPIEEASWLRFSLDNNRFEKDSIKFLKFLEKKYNFNSTKEVLKDLTKFQGFLTTSKTSLEEIKTEKFIVDWKSFFMNNDKKVKEIPTQYYFKNLVTEKDPIRWGYSTIFWGRRARKYKARLEKIYENKLLIESNQNVQEIKPPHSVNWDL